jgi:hypothetical protein
VKGRDDRGESGGVVQRRPPRAVTITCESSGPLRGVFVRRKPPASGPGKEDHGRGVQRLTPMDGVSAARKRDRSRVHCCEHTV